MTKFYITTAVALVLISSQAFAGSKAEDSAMFRLKVAACKAESKAAGIKTSSAEFYSHMTGCLDRTTGA